MTPALVFLFKIPVDMAVGTDLIFASLTKAAGVGWFDFTEQAANRLATLIGVVLGVMVTLTSVGAGAIGVAALMLLYPKLRGAAIVGSDLAHAIPLVTVAGLGHLQLGNIDYRLLVGLLLGSVPGIYIGSTVSSRLPEVMMRRILACVLLVMGIACVVGG